jgi:uncharacterized coiled-coil protein SlyX
MSSLEEKLISLETYIAHIEQFTEELNKVVVQHSETIKALTKEVNQLKERIQNQGETPGFEKPPHY